ncbi:protein kinase family protein [Sutcliffiella rhizosphaerae]|nr:protein kinase family protein [Sutcliffiella rhizosphaerae]
METNRSSKPYQQLAESIVFNNKRNHMKLISYNYQELELIGSGRSAYVFRIRGRNIAIKVFYPPFEHLAQKEASVYERLAGISYFPILYNSGKNFIVIDFVEGLTLFGCLVTGKQMNRSILSDVDDAIKHARERGLNPSDIHLHNILITPTERIILIDVVRFTQKNRCNQWNDLKKAYDLFYHKPFFPKRLPSKLLLCIAFLYKKGLFRRIFN